MRRMAKAIENRMALPGREAENRAEGLSGISVNAAESRMESPAEAISATTAGRSPDRRVVTAARSGHIR